jgi:hypothetical protein
MTRPLFKHALAVGGTKAEYLLIHIVESVAANHYGGGVVDNERHRGFESPQPIQKESTRIRLQS